MNKFIRGFTLAEVLVTLAIIGVVAAMSIPSLINSTNNTEYVTALKKFYATGNQALNKMAIDNGCAGDLKCTGIFAGDNELLGKSLIKYFNVAKDCGTDGTECWSEDFKNNYDGSNPAGYSLGSWPGYKILTGDGMSLKFYDGDSGGNDCGTVGTSKDNNSLSQLCGDIWVDVNGLKPPNAMGRDIFAFYITNGKGPMLYPIGGDDDEWEGGWRDSGGNPQACYSDDTSGRHCTGRVVADGWQMKY